MTYPLLLCCGAAVYLVAFYFDYRKYKEDLSAIRISLMTVEMTMIALCVAIALLDIIGDMK